jgi:hypothetical protein
MLFSRAARQQSSADLPVGLYANPNGPGSPASGWTVRGSNPGGGARFSAPVESGHGAHPASYAKGAGSFPGVTWPGRGVDHPTPSNAEV